MQNHPISGGKLPIGYAKDLPTSEEALLNMTTFPLLDLASGIKVVGTEGILRDLLKCLVDESLPADLKLMQAAYAQKDWEKVQNLAHKIKGGAVYVGTVRLKMACQYLERYWKVGERKLLEQLYQQLLVVIDETLSAVSAWLLQHEA